MNHTLQTDLRFPDGCMNGYDGSVMSSINAMDQWHEFFGVGKTGSRIGLVMAIYTAGQITGSFFTGFVVDTLGRRPAMAVGSVFIIIGSIIQASAFPLGAFIAGRFIVGIGVPMCTTAAPTYIVELAYPTWRGLAGGLYNVLGWYIGSLGIRRPSASLDSVFADVQLKQLRVGAVTAQRTSRVTGRGAFPTSSKASLRLSSSVPFGSFPRVPGGSLPKVETSKPGKSWSGTTAMAIQTLLL